ncbi:hypothetical protein ABG768_013939 [Culter alburnus]|uniref:Uncharacterized protein n=1 Tax=Culter alburnus TaxID=194366 RepID=A0AAW1Z764_CULAL
MSECYEPQSNKFQRKKIHTDIVHLLRTSAMDLDAFSPINPVNPAACQNHQSPTYCVRGIDGSLPGCIGENWRSLAPIIPQISKQLHVDEMSFTCHLLFDIT